MALAEWNVYNIQDQLQRRVLEYFQNAGGAGKNVKDWKILILQLQLNTNYHWFTFLGLKTMWSPTLRSLAEASL